MAERKQDYFVYATLRKTGERMAIHGPLTEDQATAFIHNNCRWKVWREGFKYFRKSTKAPKN